MGEWFAKSRDIAGDIHEWLAYSLNRFVSVHALAALSITFVIKTAHYSYYQTAKINKRSIMKKKRYSLPVFSVY